MRNIAILGSSFFLLSTLFSQEGGGDGEVLRNLKELAAASRVEAALARIDAWPPARLEDLHRVAASESREIRFACRAHLPPSSWALSEEKTIGEVRARLKRYVADLATKNPEGQDARFEAVRQLTVRGYPALMPGVLKIFCEGQPKNGYLSRIIGTWGSAEDTPHLIKLLEGADRETYAAMEAILAVADGRAEPALLKLLQSKPQEYFGLYESLSRVGGEASLEPLRKLSADASLMRVVWSRVVRTRMSLRDPRLASDLAAGSGADRHLEKIVYRGLARMGDRSVVPQLVRRLEDPQASLEDRFAALQALAVLGSREQTAVVVKCLDEPRLTATAADALAEFGDPAACGPLVQALKNDRIGKPYARALTLIPLEGIEEEILEILDNPAEYQLRFLYALDVAERLTTDRIREKLLVRLMDLESLYYDRYAVARVLAPRLAAKDLRKLSRSSSPDAPGERDDIRYARLGVRAVLGDNKALTQFVQGCRAGNVRVRMNDQGNPLFNYPGDPLELLDEVRKTLADSPEWIHGIEYLARLKPSEALSHVVKAADAAPKSRLVRGLLALRSGDPIDHSLAFTLEQYGESFLESIARALPAESVAKLRSGVLTDALNWKRESEVPDPATGKKVKRSFYSANAVGDLRLGILAARRDRFLESIYRARLRGPRSSAPQLKFTDRQVALALADLGADDQFDTFVRFLKDFDFEQRSLGAQCLGRLGDRRAIPHLAPLLDDHEREILWRLNPGPDVPMPPLPRRVCDEAADAIEALSGEKFPAARIERIAAIKAWLAKK